MKKQTSRMFIVALWSGVAIFSSQAVLAGAGEELFLKHCASCHGKDGKAKTPIARQLGVKDLTQSKLADADIEKQMIEGKKDKQGKQVMPPFKEKLSADDMKLVIEVVKGFRK